MLGVGNGYPGNLHMFKFSFGSTSTDWSLKLLWPSGFWGGDLNSESLLISFSLYTFFLYGSSTKYLYFTIISLSDNTVSRRYKSSISCFGSVYGSGASGDYIIASVCLYYLLIYNRITNVINIKFPSISPYGIGLETATNR